MLKHRLNLAVLVVHNGGVLLKFLHERYFCILVFFVVFPELIFDSLEFREGQLKELPSSDFFLVHETFPQSSLIFDVS